MRKLPEKGSCFFCLKTHPYSSPKMPDVRCMVCQPTVPEHKIAAHLPSGGVMICPDCRDFGDHNELNRMLQIHVACMIMDHLRKVVKS